MRARLPVLFMSGHPRESLMHARGPRDRRRRHPCRCCSHPLKAKLEDLREHDGSYTTSWGTTEGRNHLPRSYFLDSPVPSFLKRPSVIADYLEAVRTRPLGSGPVGTSTDRGQAREGEMAGHRRFFASRPRSDSASIPGQAFRSSCGRLFGASAACSPDKNWTTESAGHEKTASEAGAGRRPTNTLRRRATAGPPLPLLWPFCRLSALVDGER